MDFVDILFLMECYLEICCNTCYNVFGGGQKGNVIGNTDIRILNGKVHGSVTGGSYSGNIWGSAQVLVGYPSYYLCTKSAKYDVLRADNATANLNLNNTYYNASGQSYTTPTIKQSLYIMAGDIVSEQVYDAIKAKDESQVFGAFEEKTTSPSYSSPASGSLTMPRIIFFAASPAIPWMAAM